MTSPTPPGLERGERAPDMVLPAADGTRTRFYAHAGGRPALLLHAGAEELAAVRDLIPALGSERDRVTVHVVGPPALAEADLDVDGVFIDREGRAAAAFRTDGVPQALLLDANLRVRTSVGLGDGGEAARQLVDALQEMAAGEREARQIALQAPVLVVPDVLDEAARQELIELWESDNTATGVEASAGGRRAEQVTAELKRRRDHVMGDRDRTMALATTIGKRVFPEIARAFHYRAKRFEGFKIACYTAEDRGFFSLHRDNLSPATAHRKFALTLNLNDAYEGGELRFPEYGPDTYRPPAGAALVFSGSLLHEVLDVTAQRRFVLLSFLFGDEVPATPR